MILMGKGNMQIRLSCGMQKWRETRGISKATYKFLNHSWCLLGLYLLDLSLFTMPVIKADHHLEELLQLDTTRCSSSQGRGGSLGKNRRGRVEAEAGEERAEVWRADHLQGEGETEGALVLKPSSRFEITSDLLGWKDLTAEVTGRALDYRGDVMLGQGTFRHDPLSRPGGEAAAKAFSSLLLILLLRRLSPADLIGGSQLKEGLELVKDSLLHCTTFPIIS